MESPVCYLLRFIIISSVLGAFSLSINMHAQNIGTQKLLLRMCKESFDTGIMKKLRKSQLIVCWYYRTLPKHEKAATFF